MANEHPNKVILGNETLIDISSDTATAEDVTAGKTFHLASGAPATGTANYVTSLNGETGALSIKTINNEAVLGNGDISIQEGTEMVVLAYGKSTWADFMSVYPNAVVYCRASSNSNPASGSQTRMAFMAYVNNETNPTNVEFQYYRSVSSHSATQQGDQVYIYKLDKTAGWTVTVREAYTKIAPGAGMTKYYANGTLTLNAPAELPSVTSSDNGKILGVMNGVWAKVSNSGGGGSTWDDVTVDFMDEYGNAITQYGEFAAYSDGKTIMLSYYLTDYSTIPNGIIHCPYPPLGGSFYAMGWGSGDVPIVAQVVDMGEEACEINPDMMSALSGEGEVAGSIVYPFVQS